jgi:DNA-binding MarR family transcriptional regulator
MCHREDRVELEDLDLGHLAKFVGLAYDEEVERALVREGLTGLRQAHGYLFQHLLAGEPTIGELAERMEVTQQAASKSVAELEDLGYVERAADPRDGRVRRIGLTARGREAVECSRRVRRELDQRLLALADPREDLVRLLRALGAEPRIRTRRVRPPS